MEQKPYIRRVHYYETDKMGIVHHSNYIRFFEEARIEYLRNNGLDFSNLENQYGLMFPVLDVCCKYIKSARFYDELLIYVRLLNFTGVRFTLKYEIVLAEDGSLCAEGSTTIGITNSECRPISIKHKFPEIYNRFVLLAEE